MALIAVWVLIAAALLTCWVWAVVDIGRAELSDGQRLGWIAIVIFAPVVGTLAWALAGRRRR